MYIYDDKYLNWKKWEDSDFGLYNKSQFYYYFSLLKLLKLNKSNSLDVLEIGFGNGSFLGFGRNRKWNIYGIELSHQLTIKAKNNGFNVYNSIEEIMSTGMRFDLIFAFDVLEHIPPNELADYIKTIKDLTKPFGYFIGRFPNADSPFGLSNQNGDISHLNAIGNGKITYLADINQMKIKYLGGDIRPLRIANIVKTIHRLITNPIIYLIDIVINLIFYPGEKYKIAFSSRNLLAILQRN